MKWGTALAEDQLAQMSNQLDMFKTNLEEFASSTSRKFRRIPNSGCSSRTRVPPLGWSSALWKRILAQDGRCGRFLLWAGSLDYWSVPDPEAQGWRCDNSGETTTTGVSKGRGRFTQDISQDNLIRAIKKLKAPAIGFRHHLCGWHLPHSVCSSWAQYGSHCGAAAGREKWPRDCQWYQSQS